jgi:threonine/homoserine/homoserine lactone efflux protein
VPHLPWADFLTVWTILAFNIMTPGPNVLNTIVLAIGSGRAAGMGSAMGVGLGIGFWCLGTSLGLATLFAAFPVVKPVMTVVAVGLLLWFASRYARQGIDGLLALRSAEGWRPRGQEGVTMRGAFARSMAINASNPKALTTWIAVLSIFPVARAGAGDIALLCLGACALSFSIHSIYALAFSTPVAARSYLRAAPFINLGVAIFFTGFGLVLLHGALTG